MELSSEQIALNAKEQSNLAELIVSVGVHVFDASRVSQTTLRREGERLLATATYGGREFEVRVTREQILETLGREII